MPGNRMERRRFLATGGKGLVAWSVAAGFPAIVPASVFGSTSPSNRINVGAIGTGRISRGHDLAGIWQHDIARIMAGGDIGRRRVEDGKTLRNGEYAQKNRRRADRVPRDTHYHH